LARGNVFDIRRDVAHDGGSPRTFVYLKGCPLRCLWCANPEGQVERRQLFFFAEYCRSCGHCLDLCPHGASWRDGDGHTGHTPGLCRGCGECVEVCDAGARQLLGQELTVEEVLAVILESHARNGHPEGGVTLSGGEPAAQAEFATALLAECRRRGIHTAMETCGYAPWSQLAGLAANLDLVLYDLKHMDTVEHRRLTGVPNELILANLLNLAHLGVPAVVRVPVIPGCNDSAANLTALAAFVAQVSSLLYVELVPYQNFGASKYHSAGRRYPLDGLEPPARARLEELAGIIRSRGVTCRVG
jgi:pyruvate formate lyase activating enzyme